MYAVMLAVSFLLYPLTASAKVGALVFQSDSVMIWRFNGCDDPGKEYPNSISSTKDGGYIIAGEYYYGGDYTYGAWLFKIDSLFNKVGHGFYHFEGMRPDEEFYYVQQTNDEGYIATGVGVPTWGGNGAIIFLKTDSAGNKEWSYIIDTPQPEAGYLTQENTNGKYVILTKRSGTYAAIILDSLEIKQDKELFTPAEANEEGYVIHGSFIQPIQRGGFIIIIPREKSSYERNNWLLEFHLFQFDPQKNTFIESSNKKIHIRFNLESEYFYGLKLPFQRIKAKDYLLIQVTPNLNIEIIQLDSWGRKRNEFIIPTGGGLYKLEVKQILEIDNENIMILAQAEYHCPGDPDILLIKVRIPEISQDTVVVPPDTTVTDTSITDTTVTDTTVRDTTAIREFERRWIPSSFKLYQNSPNPFNPSTTIKFDLPAPCTITLEVFNVLGQRVETLIQKQYFNPGTYSIVWTPGNRDNLPSGIYFYRLKTENNRFIQTKKMILLR